MRALVACFICAFAAGFSFRSNHWESLILIDSTDYGKRLLDTINVEIKSKGSVDKIVEILNSLKADLVKQQNYDDEQIAKKREECGRVISEFTLQIDSLTSEIDQLEIDIPDLQTQVNDFTQKYNRKVGEISGLEEELISYDEAYQQDSQVYFDILEDHGEALEAVEATLEYLQNLVGSQAGEGKPETSEAIEGETRAYNYNAQKLIQLGADQETLDKLISKLNDVKSNLEMSIAAEKDRQAQADADYINTRYQISITISDLKSAKDTLRGDKESAEEELKFAKETFDAKQIERSEAESARAVKETECQNAENLYSRNKDTRTEEIETVDAILEILKNKSLEEVDKYLEDRSEK